MLKVLVSGKSSNVISLEQERVMFENGILGDENPLQLPQIVVYMMGLHLALRGGVEHSKLRRVGFDCQIIVEYDNRGKCRLVYQEDPHSKTNEGGLNSRRNTKCVYVYEASESERYPVHIFHKYISFLPEGKSCKKLYLRPKVKPSPNVWYCDQPYGNNKLSKTVRELCEKAGF